MYYSEMVKITLSEILLRDGERIADLLTLPELKYPQFMSNYHIQLWKIGTGACNRLGENPPLMLGNPDNKPDLYRKLTITALI
ncbi:MAG: hypothetical protein ABJF30_05865 [Balneola sp.]